MSRQKLHRLVHGSDEEIRACGEWLKPIGRSIELLFGDLCNLEAAATVTSEYEEATLSHILHRANLLLERTQDESPLLCVNHDVHVRVLPPLRELRRECWDLVGRVELWLSGIPQTEDEWTRVIERLIITADWLKREYKDLSRILATELAGRRRDAASDSDQSGAESPRPGDDPSSYAPMQDLWPDRFKSAAACTKFLDAHEEEIRWKSQVNTDASSISPTGTITGRNRTVRNRSYWTAESFKKK